MGRYSDGISSEAILENTDERMENLPPDRDLGIKKAKVSRVLSNGLEIFQHVL